MHGACASSAIVDAYGNMPGSVAAARQSATLHLVIMLPLCCSACVTAAHGVPCAAAGFRPAMPQGGRAPPKKGAGSQGRSQHTNPDSNTDEKSWQRSSGGFSGAAKKEYLKWKRQQKAARRADSSDDDDAVSKQQTQQPQRKPASSTQQPTSAQQQHDRQKQRTAPSAADAAVPLRYRPLAAVPAAPFVMPAHMADTSASPTTSAAAPGSGLAAAGAPSAADGSSGGSSCGSSGRNTATVMHSAEDKAAGVTYMPRVDLAEVGFTPEGFTLTMPTRPKWQVRFLRLLMALLQVPSRLLEQILSGCC